MSLVSGGRYSYSSVKTRLPFEEGLDRMVTNTKNRVNCLVYVIQITGCNVR